MKPNDEMSLSHTHTHTHTHAHLQAPIHAYTETRAHVQTPQTQRGLMGISEGPVGAAGPPPLWMNENASESVFSNLPLFVQIVAL